MIVDLVDSELNLTTLLQPLPLEVASIPLLYYLMAQLALKTYWLMALKKKIGSIPIWTKSTVL